MIVIPQKAPFFLTDVKEHSTLKKEIVSAIDSMGTFSFKNETQDIASTDWHLSANFLRPYYDLVYPLFLQVCADIQKEMGFSEVLEIKNYWYQKYNEGDWHSWHEHGNSIYSSVYYVNLPDGCAKTTFKSLGKEFEVDVKEGEILSFPSSFMHCSKPNKSKEPKIIISFNC